MLILEFIERGASPFKKWFDSLDYNTASDIDIYLRRIEKGNLGNSKSVGKGVIELKINIGHGYRIYYGRDGKEIIILLGAGSKKRQTEDIKLAQQRWEQYKKEKKSSLSQKHTKKQSSEG